MKIFKLYNPEDKTTILVDEIAGSQLMRKTTTLVNKEYLNPKAKIINPTKLEVKFGDVEISPKGEVIVDKYLGAELLHAYGFLVGKEYIEVKKGATKVAKSKIKVIKKRK